MMSTTPDRPYFVSDKRTDKRDYFTDERKYMEILSMKRVRHTVRYLLLATGFAITLFTFIVIALSLTDFTSGVNAQFIEDYLSEQIKRPVRIDSINTRWNGLLAEVDAQNIRILSQDGKRTSLQLRRLRISIDPLTLFSEQLNLERIVIYGLTLQVLRHLDGGIQIGDFAFGKNLGPNPALEWLLVQPNTEIRAAELTWIDQREPDRSLSLYKINIETENNGDEIRFHGQATSSLDLSKPVQISGEVRGQPLRSGLWDGRIELAIEQLQLDELPLVLKQSLPWNTAGLLDVRIESEWLDGHIIEADGRVRIFGFEIPFEQDRKILPVESFSSSISWQQNLENWRLVFADPSIDVGGTILRAKRLIVGRTNRTRTYYVDALEFGQVVEIVSQLPFELPWHELIAQVRSQGRFEAVSVVTRGPFLSPDYWRVESRFDGMSWRPFSGFPGVTGVKGNMAIESKGGTVRLDGTGVKVDLPGMLRESLYFNQLRGNISWARNDKAWDIRVNDLDLNNSDIRALRGRAILRVPVDRSAPPHIDSQFTIAELEIDKLSRYLPARILSPKLFAWLDNALVQGSLTGTQVELRGDLDQFPFRHGGGSFHLSSGVRNARLHYADRWPEVGEIYGSLSFNNAAMHGEISSAEIRHSRVKNAVVDSSDVFRRANELSIIASLVSPVQDAVAFLTEGPLIKNKNPLPIHAAGSGDLDLNILLPLSNLKNGVKVAGRFAVKRAELSVIDRFSFEDLNGAVDFTESSVESSGMSGTLLGGPVTLEIETIKPQQPPVWRVSARGDIDTAELVPLLQSRVMGKHVSGATPWAGTLSVDGGTAQLEIRSDLSGIEITLPEPMAKAPGEQRQSTLRASYRKDVHQYEFETGPLKGTLEYDRSAAGLNIRNGIVTVGKVKPGRPPPQGILVEISQPFLNADKWLTVLAPDETDSPQQRKSFQSALRVVQLDLDEVRFLSRNMGATNLRAMSRNGRDWNAWVSGNSISGQIIASLNMNNEPNNYIMNFDRLYLPKPRGRRKTPDPSTTRIYPNVEIQADHFVFGEWDLGRLDLKATSYVGRWRLDKFDMEQPGLRVRANGHWAYGESGSSTQIKATVHSDDIAVALKQLRLPPHLIESEVELELVLEWSGDPQSFALKKLSGNYGIDAKTGRFLDVEPGSGRLLGLLNIEEISRRFSLDFSDIFSKGLTFDQIEGQGSIVGGNLYIDGLFVVAPSALIEINGRTGLAAEDYDLQVVVAPRLGSQISMLSALANPIAGAVVFLAQKMFAKQLARMIQYQYAITGPWDLPEFTLVRREPESQKEALR